MVNRCRSELKATVKALTSLIPHWLRSLNFFRRRRNMIYYVFWCGNMHCLINLIKEKAFERFEVMCGFQVKLRIILCTITQQFLNRKYLFISRMSGLKINVWQQRILTQISSLYVTASLTIHFSYYSEYWL